MALMTVKAAPGIRVPRERSPREYITDEDAVEIRRSPYYLRRIADGDLLLVTPGQDDGQQPDAGAATEDATSPVKSRKSSQEKAL